MCEPIPPIVVQGNGSALNYSYCADAFAERAGQISPTNSGTPVKSRLSLLSNEWSSGRWNPFRLPYYAEKNTS